MNLPGISAIISSKAVPISMAWILAPFLRGTEKKIWNENEAAICFSERLTLSTYELVFTVLLRPLHHQTAATTTTMTMTKMGTISYKVVIPSYYPPAFFCLVRLSIFACLFVVLHHFVCDFNSLIVESIWSFLHTFCVDISFYSKLFHTKQQQHHQQQCGRMNDTFNKIWKSMKDQTLFFTITKLIHISSFFLQIFAALLVYFNVFVTHCLTIIQKFISIFCTTCILKETYQHTVQNYVSNLDFSSSLLHSSSSSCSCW